ncbi:MAG: hypothetical protein KH135_00325 [Firmicutes bacterium]|nr:hypothetical protein [Bacillota bacterium]
MLIAFRRFNDFNQEKLKIKKENNITIIDYYENSNVLIDELKEFFSTINTPITIYDFPFYLAKPELLRVLNKENNEIHFKYSEESILYPEICKQLNKCKEIHCYFGDIRCHQFSNTTILESFETPRGYYLPDILSYPLTIDDIKQKKICKTVSIPQLPFQEIMNIIQSIKNYKTNIGLENILLINPTNLTQQELTAIKKISQKIAITIDVILCASFMNSNGIEHDSLDEYININKLAENYIQELEHSNYSPLEKIIYIYNIVKSYHYHEDDDNHCRMLSSVLEGKDIVCVGYAKILSLLLDKIHIQNMRYSTYSKNWGHERNLIYLKDDKYKIDDFFICDACWDSNELNEYSYFLLPPEYTLYFDVPESFSIASLFALSNHKKQYSEIYKLQYYPYNDINFKYSFLNFLQSCNSYQPDFSLTIEENMRLAKKMLKKRETKKLSFEKILDAILTVRIQEGFYQDKKHLLTYIKEMLEYESNNEWELNSAKIVINGNIKPAIDIVAFDEFRSCEEINGDYLGVISEMIEEYIDKNNEEELEKETTKILKKYQLKK